MVLEKSHPEPIRHSPFVNEAEGTEMGFICRAPNQIFAVINQDQEDITNNIMFIEFNLDQAIKAAEHLVAAIKICRQKMNTIPEDLCRTTS